MRGVILCGGTGSRLLPLTAVTNKHLLPVARKQMIVYAIEKLVNIGIEEILVITGVDHCGDFVQLLKDGSDYHCQLTYKVQVKANGIAGALLLAENFIGQDSFITILGDNIFEMDLSALKNVYDDKQQSYLVLKNVKDPQRFGCPVFNEDPHYGIKFIEENPSKPQSTFAITGIYLYQSNVFDIIKNLQPSLRGEYEITDVNNELIHQNKISYIHMSGFWSDAGVFESYKLTNDWAWKYYHNL